MIDEIKKVAAYIRVSTDRDDQYGSYLSQQKYYSEKIINNPNWEFVGIYGDEGISGTKAETRPNFKRIINDSLNGKIDLILTKSISRFARNTLDTLKFVRLLRDRNIGVYFEEENINTLDIKGELLLTVLSAIAQQESINLSSHIDKALQIKMSKGEIVGNCACYGYDYSRKDKMIYPNKKQAEVVKRIYKLFLDGNSINKITKILNDYNIPSYKGGRWNHGSIAQILDSEKYVGDLLQGKFFVTDAILGRMKKNNGEKNKYYVKNHHESIISRDINNRVKELRSVKRNSYSEELIKSYLNRYSFSGKFQCGFCGNSLIRCDGHDKKTYRCRTNLRSQTDHCDNSKAIDEIILKELYMDLMIRLLNKLRYKSFDKKIIKRVNYIRTTLLDVDKLTPKKYNEKLFIDTVSYGIVGNKEDSNLYSIKFILKSNMELYDIDNYNQFAWKNKELDYYELINFKHHTIFTCFEKDKKGKLKQKFITEIEVSAGYNLND